MNKFSERLRKSEAMSERKIKTERNQQFSIDFCT